MTQVSIIVLNYNGAHFLKKCLPTITNQTYENIQTIVIDNKSSDESVAYCKSLSWVNLIQNQSNLGYTTANNIASDSATGEFLLFLNNDTELFPNTIEELVKNYEENSILAPTQIIVSGDTETRFTGNGMDIFGYPFGSKDLTKTNVFYADGAAIFIKKEDFLKIGKFDDALFIFQEDVDLSWRAQLMGFNIKKCPQASLYHYSGGVVTGGSANKEEKYASSYFRRYLNEKNVIRNILKNYSFPLCLIVLGILLGLHFIEILVLLFLGKFKVVKCYLDAYHWNISNIKDTINIRRLVQSKRTMSDLSLLKRMYWNYSKVVAFIRIGSLPIFK